MRAQVDPPKIVVTIAIVVMVLLILIFIIGRESGNFLGFIDGIRGEAVDNNCHSITLGRRCAASTDECEDANDGFRCTRTLTPYRCGGDEGEDDDSGLYCYTLRPK